jgi:hypothetical protein
MLAYVVILLQHVMLYNSVVNSNSAGRSGFDPRQGQRIFPLASVSRPALGPTHPPFPGGKARPGRDANHSPPSSAEVVNE